MVVRAGRVDDFEPKAKLIGESANDEADHRVSDYIKQEKGVDVGNLSVCDKQEATEGQSDADC